MDWPTGFFITTILFFIQGLSIVLRSNTLSERWFGGLSLLLAWQAFLTFFLFLYGGLVVSPEFGRLLVEGTEARIVLGLTLVGTAIAGALGWHVSRIEATPGEDPPKCRWLLAVALGVGLWAAFSISSINQDDPSKLQIYTYNLWHPSLLLWMAMVLVEISLTILRYTGRLILLMRTTLLAVTLSYFILDRSEVSADKAIQLQWQGVLGVATIILVIVFAWKAGVRIYRLYSRLRSGEWGRLNLSSAVAKQLTLKRSVGLPAIALNSAIKFAMVLLIGLTQIDLYYLEYLDPALDLTAFIGAWIVLAEVVVKTGPLQDLAAKAWAYFRNSAINPVNWSSKTSDVPPAPAQTSGWPTLLLKVILVIVALVALSEVPNAGKTLIQPFTVSSLGVLPRFYGRLS